LLKTTIETAVRIQAVKKSEFERVIVDTTVQEKAIAHPTDSRLLEVARGQLAEMAKKVGLSPKQTFEREGQTLRRRAGGYAHARQFKRLRKVLRRQRTILGVLMRDVHSKMDSLSQAAKTPLQDLLDRVARIHAQTASKANPSGRGKLYALHAPEVECIGKVRREVAFIIVSPAHKVGDETGRSVGRSLPVHAPLATMVCEAMGTTCRAFWAARVSAKRSRHLRASMRVGCQAE